MSIAGPFKLVGHRPSMVHDSAGHVLGRGEPWVVEVLNALWDAGERRYNPVARKTASPSPS